MANVIHRTTLEFRSSVNTPDFPEPEWKHEPDMSSVAGVQAIYWKAPADWNVANAGPVEMSQPEKDAVDTQMLSDRRDDEVLPFDDLEDLVRAFALVTLDEINLLRQRINDVEAAIENANNLADAKTALVALASLPDRTISQMKTATRSKLGT